MMSRKISILILDDEEYMSEIYQAVLRESISDSLFFYTTKDSDEALQFFRNESRKIDLLITDIMHPGFSTFNLIKILRDDYPTVKVLIISGAINMFGKDKLATADKFFHKPIKLNKLVAAVKQLLGL